MFDRYLAAAIEARDQVRTEAYHTAQARQAPDPEPSWEQTEINAAFELFSRKERLYREAFHRPERKDQ
jgi:hypothetical protein